MTYGDKYSAAVMGDPIAGGIRSKLNSTIVAPGLHIVATPIGNLADITLRALAVLTRADVIACADTRVTGKLKSTFGLSAPLLSYHDYNAAKAGGALIKRLKGGDIVALVSDAGTPLISDPGYRLVGSAIDADIAVFSVPGPTAAIAALGHVGCDGERLLPRLRAFYVHDDWQYRQQTVIALDRLLQRHIIDGADIVDDLDVILSTSPNFEPAFPLKRSLDELATRVRTHMTPDGSSRAGAGG